MGAAKTAMGFSEPRPSDPDWAGICGFADGLSRFDLSPVGMSHDACFEDFPFFLSHDPKHFGGVGAVSARSHMERTANNA
jgi:hypothetical protein